MSIQIDGLEKDLGVRLFHRTTRTVTLTEEGAALFAHVEVALNEISEGLAKVSSMAGRKADKICIPVHRRYRAICWQASCTSSETHTYRTWTSSCAKRFWMPCEMISKRMLPTSASVRSSSDDPDFVQQRIFADEIVAVLPAGSPFPNGGTVALREFADQPLLVSGPATALWKTIQDAFSTAEVITRSAPRSGSPTKACSAWCAPVWG